MNHNTTLSLAVVAALSSTSALAGGNPFGMQALSQGYLVLADAHMKSPDGKCGAMKTEKTATEEAASAKPAEGKCGAMKTEKTATEEAASAKPADGKCGAMKTGKSATEEAASAKTQEGKCGGAK